MRPMDLDEIERRLDANHADASKSLKVEVSSVIWIGLERALQLAM